MRKSRRGVGYIYAEERNTAPKVFLLLIGTCLLLFRCVGPSPVHPCDEFVGRRFGIGRPSLGL